MVISSSLNKYMPSQIAYRQISDETRAVLLETLTSICLVSLQFIMEKTPLDILVLTFGQNWAQLTKIDWPSVTLERILETKTSVL